MNMMEEPKGNGRQVGGTEYSWCRAMPGGTGIAVLAILTTKTPDALLLHNALNKLQNFHPILRSRLHTNYPSKNNFSFVTSSAPFIQIKSYNLSSTCKILENVSSPTTNLPISPLQVILEHELNENVWCTSTNRDDLFFASMYSLPNTQWVVVLRLHVLACDRTTAVSLLRELLLLVGEEQEGNDNKVVFREMGNKGEVSLPIEDLIPSEIAPKKALWTRGFDMLGYSVNSLRSTNLKFIDVKSPRCSAVVRFQMNKDETQRIILGCKSRGIKLCGALAAAGLIAAQRSKRSHSHYQHHQRKYGVATLIDCRSLLEPPLSAHHFGFYHSVIMNTHITKGEEKLWDLAKRMYMAFANSKNCNQHFTDMADLNFLMIKALQNPSLTSSSSSRSSFMSVFEDTVVDDSTDNNYKQQAEALGVEDYIGCASVHGLGPSIAVFDTIRDGRLDCVCVYPSPLHSREQMQSLIESMKSVLVDADN